jgi:rhodanese-related sulfurtransferase
MFGFGKSNGHKEIGPDELHAMLGDGSALLVDVRESDEFAGGHIEGAINMPLSQFQPSQLPDANGRTIVLQCAGGVRSAKALDKCAAAEQEIDTHLAGGIGGWIKAGYPVVGG